MGFAEGEPSAKAWKGAGEAEGRELLMEQCQIDALECRRPHVLLLGAGASVAAFPDGERNGRMLPIMANLISTLQMEEMLDGIGVNWRGRNFETVYSELHEGGHHTELLTKIEGLVREYFTLMALPDTPTLYDRLVLSLRPKDVIATFNWDPFLFDACVRNQRVVGKKLPHILFLHGNVRLGHCPEHPRGGALNGTCRECGQRYVPSRLIFPVSRKNYNDHPFLAAAWRDLKRALETAYLFTIFGYGAPNSDVEALDLMRDAWGPAPDRVYEQIEIIDVKNHDELAATWQDFIYSHHWGELTEFAHSLAARYPRRTCEGFWAMSMELNIWDNFPMPATGTIESLHEWCAPLMTAESKKTR